MAESGPLAELGRHPRLEVCRTAEVNMYERPLSIQVSTGTNLQGVSQTIMLERWGGSKTEISKQDTRYDDTEEDLLDSDWETRPVVELEDDTQYEREDWDKELSDACPYDSEDVLEIESHQNDLKTYCCEESKSYDPSCHHAEPVTAIVPARCPVLGQFDDADD
ncbi:coordinator of PRMT5 and differentiation stimulator isoform X3 [Lissotriton helveticus]